MGEGDRSRAMRFLSGALLALTGLGLGTPAPAQDKQLLWGDTHLHSSYSADAYLNNNFTADPDTAYRYARGLPVIHPFHRARVQIETPLDFLVVSDHAEFLGIIRQPAPGGIDRRRCRQRPEFSALRFATQPVPGRPVGLAQCIECGI